MYLYDTLENNDQDVDSILRYLFEYEAPVLKQKQFQYIEQQFQQLSFSGMYLLFSLVSERLPHRAKLLFCAEDYQGKTEMILEVMNHLCDRKS